MTANSTARRRGSPPQGTSKPTQEKQQNTTTQDLQTDTADTTATADTGTGTGAMRLFGKANRSADSYELLSTEEQQRNLENNDPLLYGSNKDCDDEDEDGKHQPRKAADIAGRLAADQLPQWLAIGAMLGLIFGGCCSNVYALEAIIKVEPSAGTLLTFVQFLFVAITGYISQFDSTRPPLFLRRNKVPLRRWIVNIVLFFAINVLNNHAFSYDISVPVHIILRSGGSITTMVAGSLYGKKYSRVQVIAVVLLTLGVITAAWSDSQTKTVADPVAEEEGETGTGPSEEDQPNKPAFSTGLIILFVAQILSAIMGLYTEETYRQYGPQWKENLFYSHLLSLPLFLPFMPSLVRQFNRLADSPPLTLPGWGGVAVESLPHEPRAPMNNIQIPSQLAYLVINVLTQYACIRGVNLLAAASTALTVTIVLNIRKLVSLLLSIWLFGNRLAAGTLLGAVVVFGSGGLYSLDSKKKQKPDPQQKDAASK